MQEAGYSSYAEESAKPQSLSHVLPIRLSNRRRMFQEQMFHYRHLLRKILRGKAPKILSIFDRMREKLENYFINFKLGGMKWIP